MLSKKSFARGMMVLDAAYQNRQPFTKEQTELWYRLLADIPDNAFEEAILYIARNNKYLPTPAEIRTAADEMQNGPKLSASEAWREVLKAVSAHGLYSKPEFDNPVIADAVASVGYWNICMTDQNGMGTLRAHFHRAYESAQKREKLCSEKNMISASPERRGLQGFDSLS